MNTPSPLQPLGRAPSSGHSSWNLAIVIIVTLHVVFFAGLLQQGCRRPTSETAGTTNLGLTPTQPTNAASDAFAGYAPPYTPPATTPEPTNLDAYTPPAAVDTNFLPAATTVPTSYWANATFQPTNLVTTPEPAPVPAPTTFTEHKIAAGDTPARIARKYSLTLDQLREANPDMNDRRLQIGQTLRIPAPAPRVTAAATPEAATGETVHVVQAGETLTRIAARYGTTVQELRRYNNLRTDRILVQQRLKIPPTAAKAHAAPQP